MGGRVNGFQLYLGIDLITDNLYVSMVRFCPPLGKWFASERQSYSTCKIPAPSFFEN